MCLFKLLILNLYLWWVYIKPLVYKYVSTISKVIVTFSRYYWFYQHVAQRMTPPIPKSEENDPKVAAAVTKMWKELGEEERNTMVTMAALDSSQDSDGSHLSDDLLDVNVVPINEIISFQLKGKNLI